MIKYLFLAFNHNDFGPVFLEHFGFVLFTQYSSLGMIIIYLFFLHLSDSFFKSKSNNV